MKLDKTNDSLHDFGRWLFKRIADMAGREGGEPVFQSSGWYRAPAKGKVCLYLYFLGSSGRTRHPNSVRMTTLWDEGFKAMPWIEKGNNWFGSPSADFHVRPDDPKAKGRAENFIRQAFKVVAVDVASQAATTEETRNALRKHIGHIARDDEQASEGAHWLKEFLKGVGKSTAGSRTRDSGQRRQRGSEEDIAGQLRGHPAVRRTGN